MEIWFEFWNVEDGINYRLTLFVKKQRVFLAKYRFGTTGLVILH